MPTGYTAGVQDGSIKTLKAFGMLCARAFGVRELDSDIPEFEPSPYHLERINEIKADLALYAVLTPQAMEEAAIEEYEQELVACKKRQVKMEQTRQNYASMMRKVEDWVPPYGMLELKKFMLQQLSESIRFDCYDIEFSYKKKTGIEWYTSKLEQAQKDLAYHQNEYAKEVQRTQERNDWINKLKESLDGTQNQDEG